MSSRAGAEILAACGRRPDRHVEMGSRSLRKESKDLCEGVKVLSFYPDREADQGIVCSSEI